MSTIVVVAPLIIAGWPVIAAAVTAAVSSLGFSVAKSAAGPVEQAHVQGMVKAEIAVESSEIMQGSLGCEEIVVERDGIRAVFSRDARGTLKLCMEGTGHSKAELKKIGQDLIDRVTQQYVYHRIVTELKDRNMTIVNEEVAEDRTVKIRVRNL